jgi:hypothetical protein
MRVLIVAAVSVACLVMFPAAASATDRNVCGGCTYTTIQAAVDASATGDNVIVGAGLYVESVVVPGTISIIGPSAAIDGSSRAVPDASEAIIRTDGAGPALQVGSGTTIDGVIAEGAGANAAVRVLGGGATITDSVLRGGTTVVDIDLTSVAGVLIERSRLDGDVGRALDATSSAGAPPLTIRSSRLTGTGGGIEVDRLGTLTIDRLDVQGGAPAVHVGGDVASTVIQDSAFARSTGTATDGVRFDTTRAATANGSVTFARNIFTGIWTNYIYVASGSPISGSFVLRQNRFVPTLNADGYGSSKAFRSASTFPVDAEQNWWGCNSSPESPVLTPCAEVWLDDWNAYTSFDSDPFYKASFALTPSRPTYATTGATLGIRMVMSDGSALPATPLPGSPVATFSATVAAPWATGTFAPSAPLVDGAAVVAYAPPPDGSAAGIIFKGHLDNQDLWLERAVAIYGPKPVASTEPAVTGTRRPGGTLTCTPGTWSPLSYVTATFHQGEEFSPPRNVAVTYKVTTEDVGEYVRCNVDATSPTYSTDYRVLDVFIPYQPMLSLVALSPTGRAVRCGSLRAPCPVRRSTRGSTRFGGRVKLYGGGLPFTMQAKVRRAWVRKGGFKGTALNGLIRGQVANAKLPLGLVRVRGASPGSDSTWPAQSNYVYVFVRP